jgi:hypothetical protein
VSISGNFLKEKELMENEPEMSDLVSRPTPKEAERFKKMLEGAGNGAVTETEKSSGCSCQKTWRSNAPRWRRVLKLVGGYGSPLLIGEEHG